MMTDNDNIAEAKDGALRKLGRNLHLFQEAEHALKLIVASQGVAGPIEDIGDIRRRLGEAVSGQTMGALLKPALEGPAPVDEEEADNYALGGGVHFALSFGICGSDATKEERRVALDALLGSRNDLAHHFFPRYPLTSIPNCREAEAYLDEQHEKHRLSVEGLRAHLKSMKDGIDLLLAGLKDPANRNEFVYGPLRKHPFVQKLKEFAIQNVREDGWAELGSAVRTVKEDEPETFEEFKQLGSKSVTDFVSKVGAFGIKKETSQSGGVRMLYRVQDESLEHDCNGRESK